MIIVLKPYIEKYKAFILYIIAGGLTTVVNAVIYWGVIKLCISNVPATLIAWGGAVIFAFFVNKFFVFNSKSVLLKNFFREFIFFVSCRILSGGLDVLFMYITVDIFDWNGLLMKLLSLVIMKLKAMF